MREDQLALDLSLEHHLYVYFVVAGRSVAPDYLEDNLPCDVKQTMALANAPTRLKRLGLDRPLEASDQLEYAVCDAALRKHLQPAPQKPLGWSYPESLP